MWRKDKSGRQNTNRATFVVNSKRTKALLPLAPKEILEPVNAWKYSVEGKVVVGERTKKKRRKAGNETEQYHFDIIGNNL